MEEDIKLLEKLVEDSKKFFGNFSDDKTDFYWKTEQALKEAQAIENLINKYKEQEKMIKLMARFIKINTSDDGLSIRPATIEEKIEFFRKKAKGE